MNTDTEMKVMEQHRMNSQCQNNEPPVTEPTATEQVNTNFQQGGYSYGSNVNQGYQQNQSAYTPNDYQNNGYQNNNYQNNAYPNGNNAYPNGNSAYQANTNYNAYQQNNMQQMDSKPLSVGEWVLTILALAVPCVGLVLYCVWAFGKSGNVNRRNYCRAALIIEAVVIVLYIVLMIIIFATTGAAIGSMY